MRTRKVSSGEKGDIRDDSRSSEPSMKASRGYESSKLPHWLIAVRLGLLGTPVDENRQREHKRTERGRPTIQLSAREGLLADLTRELGSDETGDERWFLFGSSLWEKVSEVSLATNERLTTMK